MKNDNSIRYNLQMMKRVIDNILSYPNFCAYTDRMIEDVIRFGEDLKQLYDDSFIDGVIYCINITTIEITQKEYELIKNSDDLYILYSDEGLHEKVLTYDTETIVSYELLGEASEAFKKYKNVCRKDNDKIFVDVYELLEYQYDEDGKLQDVVIVEEQKGVKI